MNQENLLWEHVLERLEKQISKPAFETWLKWTKVKVEGNRWFVIAANEFSRDWLESRYLSDIKEAIQYITNEAVHVGVIVDKQNTEEERAYSNVESIRNQILLLTESEKTELFSFLKTNERQISSELHSNDSRVNELEHEVERLRREIADLHVDVKLLKIALANQMSKDEQRTV